MSERALAHIEKIEWIKPIEGADNIELIGVLGWVCIAKKQEFKEGDLAVYIEIDSKCPKEDERFAFLESKGYKVKTMKLGKFKVFSQGLALPIELFPELKGKRVGSDVTEQLKITYSNPDDVARKAEKPSGDAKYNAMINRRKKLFKNPVVKRIMRYKLGRNIMFFLFGSKQDKPLEFPKWIVKTDETRIENAPFYLNSTDKWIKTEKLDGTSCTYAVERLKKDKFDFIVCSRNLRLPKSKLVENPSSRIYWELAEKYNIEKILTKYATEHKVNKLVLQGEGVGFVQGNPYKLDENKFFAFNLIIDGKRFGTMEMDSFCKENNLTTVPIIDEAYELPHTMEEMKLEADGFSALNSKVKREGFVYRSLDGSQSFKNVSREYLLKHS